jgi:hypothetical protein
MSDDDFEALSLGTIEELRTLRKFARDMIEFNKLDGMALPQEMRIKIGLLEIFYAAHVERYPQ